MASENYNSDFSGYIVDPKIFNSRNGRLLYRCDWWYIFKKINSIIENKDSSKTDKKMLKLLTIRKSHHF